MPSLLITELREIEQVLDTLKSLKQISFDSIPVYDDNREHVATIVFFDEWQLALPGDELF